MALVALVVPVEHSVMAALAEMPGRAPLGSAALAVLVPGAVWAVPLSPAAALAVMAAVASLSMPAVLLMDCG